MFDATEENGRIHGVARAAGGTESVYASDDVPERLLDAVADHRYVHFGGLADSRR